MLDKVKILFLAFSQTNYRNRIFFSFIFSVIKKDHNKGKLVIALSFSILALLQYLQHLFNLIKCQHTTTQFKDGKNRNCVIFFKQFKSFLFNNHIYDLL